MQSPESNSNHELISFEDIPLEYRLAHLGIDSTIIHPKLTATAIASSLELDTTPVTRDYLRRYDIEPEIGIHPDTDREVELYPHYVLEFIREEKAWRDWYRTLPTYMNTKQIAEGVGRSYGWTTKTLQSLYPNARRPRGNTRSRVYHRKAVKELRELTFATPPDEDWYSIPMLVETIGKDRDWILKRLDQQTIRPELRRQASTGREFPYYPPETIMILRDAVSEAALPAGDWLTANALEEVTGKSTVWVSKRLKEQFDVLGEERLDDMGVERIHYPPSVREALENEVAELHEYAEADDWVTISTLRRKLGLHAVTITRIIRQAEIESEMRLDKKGRPKQHFSPQAQARLAQIAFERLSHPEAGEWLTLTEVQKILGRPKEWIRSQFAERSITPEIRLDKSRRPAEHYDPAQIAEIKREIDNNK